VTEPLTILVAARDEESSIAATVTSLRRRFAYAEVIVADDGSTDGTAAAVEPYRDRIRYVRQDHGGVASAWNAALKSARGDFFAVLGADDAYLPERLEALAELSARRPDLDLLCTDLVYEVEQRPVGTFGETCPFAVVDQRGAILERCFCAAPAMRRSALDRIGGFEESLRTGSDWECAIRLIYSGSSAGLVDEPLYRYRIHRLSLTADRLGTLRDRIRFLERVGQHQVLDAHERAALARSLARQRSSLALGEAEVAVRSRSRDARRLALAAARMPDVRLPYRAAALSAALAPRVAARGLEWREQRRGDRRLRSPWPPA